MNMQNLYDFYDEEFLRYICLSKPLIGKLPDIEDRRLCAWWVSVLCNIQDKKSKSRRNNFLKFMLHMIRDGFIQEDFRNITPDGRIIPDVDASSLGIPDKKEALEWVHREVLQAIESPRYVSNWSADKRTYVAVCPLEGKGALIYMAVAKDPSLGWDFPGL